MAFDDNIARFLINGLPSEDGSGNRGVIVANAALLTLQLETIPSGALSATFQVSDATDATAPLASLDAPEITFITSGTSSELLTDPDTQTATINMVAFGADPSTDIHSYIFRCTVSTADGPQVFERIISTVGVVTGSRKTVVAELQQFEARGWSDEFNRLTDAIEDLTVAGSGYATIQDETVPLTQRPSFNFVGSGVTAVDDAGNNRTNITIPGISGLDLAATYALAGNTVAITAAAGEIELTQSTSADVTPIMTMTRSPGADTLGRSLDITMGDNATDHAIHIQGGAPASGTNALLHLEATAVGRGLIECVSAGQIVFQIPGAGNIFMEAQGTNQGVSIDSSDVTGDITIAHGGNTHILIDDSITPTTSSDMFLEGVQWPTVAPSAGEVLTATSGTAAAWQAAAGSGSLNAAYIVGNAITVVAAEGSPTFAGTVVEATSPFIVTMDAVTSIEVDAAGGVKIEAVSGESIDIETNGAGGMNVAIGGVLDLLGEGGIIMDVTTGTTSIRSATTEVIEITAAGVVSLTPIEQLNLIAGDNGAGNGFDVVMTSGAALTPNTGGSVAISTPIAVAGTAVSGSISLATGAGSAAGTTSGDITLQTGTISGVGTVGSINLVIGDSTPPDVTKNITLDVGNGGGSIRMLNNPRLRWIDSGGSTEITNTVGMANDVIVRWPLAAGTVGQVLGIASVPVADEMLLSWQTVGATPSLQDVYDVSGTVTLTVDLVNPMVWDTSPAHSLGAGVFAIRRNTGLSETTVLLSPEHPDDSTLDGTGISISGAPGSDQVTSGTSQAGTNAGLATFSSSLGAGGFGSDASGAGAAAGNGGIGGIVTLATSLGGAGGIAAVADAAGAGGAGGQFTIAIQDAGAGGAGTAVAGGDGGAGGNSGLFILNMGEAGDGGSSGGATVVAGAGGVGQDATFTMSLGGDAGAAGGGVGASGGKAGDFVVAGLTGGTGTGTGGNGGDGSSINLTPGAGGPATGSGTAGTDGLINLNGVAQLDTHVVANLPPVGAGGGIIHVSDETGGPIPAYSDGTNWRRFSDGAIVS